MPTLSCLCIETVIILVQLAFGSRPSSNALSYLPFAHQYTIYTLALQLIYNFYYSLVRFLLYLQLLANKIAFTQLLQLCLQLSLQLCLLPCSLPSFLPSIQPCLLPYLLLCLLPCMQHLPNIPPQPIGYLVLVAKHAIYANAIGYTTPLAAFLVYVLA